MTDDNAAGNGRRHSRPRIAPPAMVLLNNRDLIAGQVADFENIAKYETWLSDSGGRDRLWRIATALRVVNKLVEHESCLLTILCHQIDHDRAQGL